MPEHPTSHASTSPPTSHLPRLLRLHTPLQDARHHPIRPRPRQPINRPKLHPVPKVRRHRPMPPPDPFQNRLRHHLRAGHEQPRLEVRILGHGRRVRAPDDHLEHLDLRPGFVLLGSQGARPAAQRGLGPRVRRRVRPADGGLAAAREDQGGGLLALERGEQGVCQGDGKEGVEGEEGVELLRGRVFEVLEVGGEEGGAADVVDEDGERDVRGGGDEGGDVGRGEGGRVDGDGAEREGGIGR